MRYVLVAVILLALPAVYSLGGNHVHKVFDWEGDGASDTGDDIPQEFESCFACHELGIFGGASRVCEECHLPSGYGGAYGPFSEWSDAEGIHTYVLRPDYYDPGVEPPMVYQHYFDAPVKVPSQLTQFQKDLPEIITLNNITLGNVSEKIATFEITLSKCFGYSNELKTGTCHGVSNENSPDGKFAFYVSASLNQSDPYTFQTDTSKMPDTTDCMYCHVQGNAAIRTVWGSPIQVTGSNSNDGCYGCHVVGGVAPANFHAPEVTLSNDTNPHVTSGGGGGGGGGAVEEEEDPVETFFKEGTNYLTTNTFKLIIVEMDLRYGRFFLSSTEHGGLVQDAFIGPLAVLDIYPRPDDPSVASALAKEAEIITGDPYGVTAQMVRQKYGFKDTVVVARGDLGADSMAAVAYARVAEIPILLTKPGEVPQVTLDTLSSLGTRNVIILGGTAAVSEEAEAQLAEGYSVERITGKNRAETAVAIARKMGPPEAVVVTDYANPSRDAATMASLFGAPVLYANSTYVEPVLADYLTEHRTTPNGAKLRVIDLGLSANTTAQIKAIVDG